ncbi:hypothetical protein RhiirA4_468598 [Rhizophagus irregularis]|uniref:Uncharacterized protein n=1 Tax=Rhizophagus irregularis TaxID=588596 RepID=A0A2I1GY13_9GLOM|nr:hypothetical protein RhiirA4_468598 [Rhizophagus irregularis]
MEAFWVVWTTERGVSRKGLLGCAWSNSIVVCSSEVSTDGMIYLSALSQFAFLCNRFDLGLCFLIDFELEVRTFIIMQNNYVKTTSKVDDINDNKKRFAISMACCQYYQEEEGDSAPPKRFLKHIRKVDHTQDL